MSWLKKTEHILSILYVVQITSQIFDSRNINMGGFKMMKSLLDHLESFPFSKFTAQIELWNFFQINWKIWLWALLKFLGDNINSSYWSYFANGDVSVAAYVMHQLIHFMDDKGVLDFHDSSLPQRLFTPAS